MIAATRDALVNSTSETISLRSLAEKLGVSQPAPYRHFKSREALLHEVAADGFIRLNTTLSECLDKAPSPQGIASACSAYVELALSNMGVYQLMFSGALIGGASSSSTLTEASDHSFALLNELVVRRTGKNAASAMAVLVWAALHGIVTLTAEGLITGAAGDNLTVDVLVENMLDRLGLTD